MVFDNQKLVALLPANRFGNTVFSHQGLTYGGLVYTETIKLAEVISILKKILEYLKLQQIEKLQIKMLPPIYPSKPSGELDYALFLADAKLTRRDSLSVIDLSRPYKFSKDRRKCVKRGESAGLRIDEDNNFALFWNEILIPNMKQKHGVSPVHSLAEIEKLHAIFPENIRQFNVYHENRIVAGTTVFVTENVAHPQYISGQASKNELGSLDFLYNHLISDVFKEKRFFDFGISNEQQGRKLNHGLQFWKESFGTTTVVQDFYDIDTANFNLLENALP